MKWQEKVEAMGNFSKFVKEHGQSDQRTSEAIVVYANSLSKDFKAANMNILKCGLECVERAAEVCGIGPRVAKSIMLSLIPKVCASVLVSCRSTTVSLERK